MDEKAINGDYIRLVTEKGSEQKQVRGTLQVLLLALAMACVAAVTSFVQHWWDMRSLAAGDPQARRHVLIVLDMQKDYDCRANVQMYGKILSPYCGDISSIVSGINIVRRSRRWDKVIWTQDWLAAEPLIAKGQHPFCIANTTGATLLEGLATDPSTDFFYSKSMDDAFNIVPDVVFCGTASSDSGKPLHGYGLRNEGLQLGAPSNALIDILHFWNFSPSNTVISVAGQMTDRCVMKTAIHARSMGYEVILESSAIYTNEEKPDSDWNLPSPESFSQELLAEILRIDAGPGKELGLAYMKASGVSIRT